ncbi:MAG: glycosyltransferase [Planctomycetota bacterium]
MTLPSVTLVIPGRNCASTLDRCLSSVVPLKSSGQLEEIIFVDDGSTDATAEIAARYPVRVIRGTGQGPGSARNLGWQAAESELIWFIDSDCVAEPDALKKLLPHMTDPEVAGVGGSYSNLYPDSLIATLIHEEILARHRRMPQSVNFLATFNVIYRRYVLQYVDGFDESLKLAQDAELAYRIIAAGHRLRFEFESRVGHHHPRSFWRYLRTQCRQGSYRMKLYRSHPSMVSGDSYAGLID